MATFNIFYSIIGFILCSLAAIHAVLDGREHRIQRLLILLTSFLYAILLEYIGITGGNHYYAEDVVMILGIIPISIPLAWVGIIYSAMIIGERLELSPWKRILATTLIALSLDWGMDPIAVEIGLWTWVHEGGSYFGVPSFNFIGWFLIPIAYSIAYNLNWNTDKKRLEILSIKEIDTHDTWSRKLYTIFLVLPIGIGLLMIFGLVTIIPIIYNLPLIIVIILEILTVAGAIGIIVLKREILKRSHLYDLIPPSILLFIAYSYILSGLFTVNLALVLLMFLTAIPLLLAFIFIVQKK